MKLHLVDGTFELFRGFFGSPPAKAPDGREVGASRALLRSMASLIRQPDVTHVAIAFDHVIESFRNELFAGYKTGDGIEPTLYQQFELAERAAAALGMTVWPMVEFEADDALASAAHRHRDACEQVVLCSPDKDLCQCVTGERVVTEDRIRKTVTDEPGVWKRFGVGPPSIPDYLALVGDTADGIPGIPRWGAKSTATVLARYHHLEAIPPDPNAWDVKVRGAATLAANLEAQRDNALLYRHLATLRLDVPLTETLADLAYHGPTNAFVALCEEIGERPDRFEDL
ncbi:MAG: flap endonuclease [Myxococcales bacterium]|nr:flap endonuclease [Myxococcales bacterium]